MPILTPTFISSPPGSTLDAPASIIPTSQTNETLIIAPNEHTAPAFTLNVPTVRLDAPTIGIALATRLASSLLEHILFLKSQIPLPVAQLQRISARTIVDDDAMSHRNAKRRAGAELLDATQELSTDLSGAFGALSDALARRRTGADGDGSGSSKSARASVMYVLGGSANAPKARVVLVFDGLELRIHREDKKDDASSDDADAETDSSADEGDAGVPPASPSPTPSPSSSRSPSPRPPQIDDSPVPKRFAPTIGDENSPRPGPIRKPRMSAPLGGGRMPLRVLQPSSSMVGRESIAPLGVREDPAERARAEEQSAIRSAERVLARELAQACGADDGGLAAELAPTQTYVFLRAPRRFSHPSWIPRQRETRALDETLERFLDESGIEKTRDDSDDDSNADEDPRVTKKPPKGVKTEGVWIGARDAGPGKTVTTRIDEGEEDDDDEFIWWSWDGKIVGFTDW